MHWAHSAEVSSPQSAQTCCWPQSPTSLAQAPQHCRTPRTSKEGLSELPPPNSFLPKRSWGSLEAKYLDWMGQGMWSLWEVFYQGHQEKTSSTQSCCAFPASDSNGVFVQSAELYVCKPHRLIIYKVFSGSQSASKIPWHPVLHHWNTEGKIFLIYAEMGQSFHREWLLHTN